MDEFTQGLERHLADLSDRVDPQSELRVKDGISHAQHRRRRRNRVLAATGGAALAVTSVVTLNALGVLGGSQPPTTVQNAPPAPGGLPGDGLPVVKPGEPCPGARHASSPAQLETKVPHWEPKDANPTDAWTCGDTPVLLYDTIQISYEDGWGSVDVEQKFEALARDYGGTVETVLGRPAWIHPPDEAGPNSSVQVVVGDILIRLLAEGSVPADDLKELAQTIELPPSKQR